MQQRRLFTPILMLVLASAAFAVGERAFVDSCNGLAHEHIFSNIRRSILLFERAIEQSVAAGYEDGEAIARQRLGTALCLNGQYDESTAAYLQAIRLLEKTGNKAVLAQTCGDLGYMMKRWDMPGAFRYMSRGIRIAEEHGCRQELVGLYNNYGVLLEMSSLPDSAGWYYKKSLQLTMDLGDSTGIPFCLNNLASICTNQGEYAEAESLLQRSDRYRNAEPGSYGRMENSVLWGDNFLHQGLLDSATTRYSWTIAQPEAFEQHNLVKYCYGQLASIHEAREDFASAYRNQRAFMAYKDSLLNLETHSRIAALEIEYESEVKDREIAEGRLAIARRNRQLGLLGGLLFLLLAAGVAGSRYQHLKREKHRREQELKARLRQAEAEQRITQEKLRISRELHDNIGSQLTFLVHSVDALEHVAGQPGHQAAGLEERIGELGEYSRYTLDELRNTVWAMKHEHADLEQLMQRLHGIRRQIMQGHQKLQLEIVNHIPFPRELGSSLVLALLRITQEAIQNAVRHAGASWIKVQLEAVEDAIQLQIRDDGSGFDMQETERSSGLDHMRQRCEAEGGVFQLESSAAGTLISCRFPAE